MGLEVQTLAAGRTGKSPCRSKLKAVGSRSPGISKPVSFSEDAMDSYFSASNDDVFLGPLLDGEGQVVSPSRGRVLDARPFNMHKEKGKGAREGSGGKGAREGSGV